MLADPWRLLQSFFRHVQPPFGAGGLAGRPLLRKIFANASWLIAERVLRLVLALVVSVWVARFLGPADFGRLNFAVSVALMFGPLADVGLEKIVVRDLARDRSRSSVILVNAIALQLVGGSSAILAAVLAINVLRPGDDAIHGLVLVAALPHLLEASYPLNYWFQSCMKLKYIALAGGASALCVAGLTALFIAVEAGVGAFVWRGMVEQTTIAALLFIFFRYQGATVAVSGLRLREMLSLLRDSWPVIFAGFAVLVYTRLDQIMIGKMIGDTEVGYYSVAAQSASVFLLIGSALLTAAFPSIVEAHERASGLFLQRMQELYNGVCFFGYTVAISITLLAGPLIQLLFGEAYAPASPMLIFLAWATIFAVLGSARAHFLYATNRTTILAAALTIGACANVALNLYLIPKYGGVGAAVATLVSQWIAAHGTCFVFPSLNRNGIMIAKALLWPKIGKFV